MMRNKYQEAHVGAARQRNQRCGYAGDDARMVKLLQAFLVHRDGGRAKTICGLSEQASYRASSRRARKAKKTIRR